MVIEMLRNRSDKPVPPGITEKVAYGMGDFASCMLYVATQSFLMFYYTEYVGVDIGLVATLMLASRLFDGFSDIFMGHLIERTSSPYGKTRVWILRMLIPYVLGCVLLFSVPPELGDTAKLIYIFFSYNLAITVVYTAINLPYGAMNTLMTDDSHQRSIIVIYRMVLAAGGSAFINAVTMPLVRFFGNDTRAWSYTFVVVGLLGAAIFFCTFFFCHERIASPPPPPEERDFKRAMRGLFSNRYWIMLTLAMVFVCCSDVCFNTSNIYYCRYFLNDAGLVGPFALLASGGRIGAMIVILPFLLKPLGKRNCLLIACVTLTLALLLRFFWPHSESLMYVSAVLYGMGQGFTYSTLFAMIPDTVEYGEFRDGERHEGYIYAGASFGTKVAAGLGPVLMGFVLSMGGYVADAETQSGAAQSAILVSTTWLPIALLVLGFVAMIGYHLDKEYPEIIEKLHLRHAAGHKPESRPQSKSEQQEQQAKPEA